ncbi:hypothetical protein Tco_1159185, partial [Tanacetum coccineum]
MFDFDVILGMDWLASHRATIDCLNKRKQIWKPKGKLFNNSLNKTKQIWKPKGKLSDNSLNKTKWVWKATSKLFTNVGYQWRPTGKKFALGELCPLTRPLVTCTTISANQQDPQFTPTQIGDPKFQTLQIRLFSNAGGTDHPLVSGLRLFKTYDGESFKSQELCGKTMAPVRISSGPELIMMTPGQLNSGLAPSHVLVTTYIPPTDKDLKILFQPMFDEYFDQSTYSDPVPMATIVNAPIVSTNTSVSTTIAQDAHSTSHSLSSSQVHPPVFPQGVAAGPTIEDTSITQADLHPSVNPVAGEPSSAQSTSGDVSL